MKSKMRKLIGRDNLALNHRASACGEQSLRGHDDKHTDGRPRPQFPSHALDDVGIIDRPIVADRKLKTEVAIGSSGLQHSTRQDESADSRFATTQPADPAPTMM